MEEGNENPMTEIPNQNTDHRPPASDLSHPKSGSLSAPVRITGQVWPEGMVPVVSICCITYQHVNFIREAVEGFLMQETTFPVEIIIRDDASTDGTAEIVREYQEKYPQLIRTILHTENQSSKGKIAFPEYLPWLAANSSPFAKEMTIGFPPVKFKCKLGK